MPKFIELQADEKISTKELFGYAMKIFTDSQDTPENTNQDNKETKEDDDNGGN